MRWGFRKDIRSIQTEGNEFYKKEQSVASQKLSTLNTICPLSTIHWVGKKGSYLPIL